MTRLLALAAVLLVLIALALVIWARARAVSAGRRRADLNARWEPQVYADPDDHVDRTLFDLVLVARYGRRRRRNELEREHLAPLDVPVTASDYPVQLIERMGYAQNECARRNGRRALQHREGEA